MTKLIKYLKPYTLSLIAILVLVFFQVAANLKLPDYASKIVDDGIVAQNNHIIWVAGGWMLLVTLGGAICTVIAGFLSSKVATGFSKTIREKVFENVENFSMKEFDQFSTASLITRSTNDIQQVQMVLIMILRIVLMAPIMAIWAIIKAYQIAPSMSWIIVLAVIVTLGMISIIFAVAMPKFKALQKLVDKLNLIARENLTGLRVIRAFNTEKFQEKKFDSANKELTDVNLFVNRISVVLMPMITLIVGFATLAIVWFGAHLIGNGNLLIGNMLAFMQYAIQVIMAFLMISIIFIMVPRASVSGQRIAEVIATEPIITDPKNPQKFLAEKSGLVEFKNVTFSYAGADSPVLKNINFSANPGETTAIIGSTGSGKSTLINLIPRFYDVTQGQILVDGTDIREVTQADLHDKIGYIPQKSSLFSGTVSSNIKYGALKATEKEVKNAAQIAQAYDFIDEMEDKFDAPIAQAGANVSGGQKQRLSIARAIVKNPEIYIFDDSFSALDLKTDSLLRKALKAETKGATVLIVAQRISTIMEADKIIVLDEGKIAGIGTHEQLLKNCKVYKEIALSQLSVTELRENNREKPAAKLAATQKGTL